MPENPASGLSHGHGTPRAPAGAGERVPDADTMALIPAPGKAVTRERHQGGPRATIWIQEAPEGRGGPRRHSCHQERWLPGQAGVP